MPIAVLLAVLVIPTAVAIGIYASMSDEDESGADVATPVLEPTPHVSAEPSVSPPATATAQPPSRPESAAQHEPLAEPDAAAAPKAPADPTASPSSDDRETPDPPPTSDAREAAPRTKKPATAKQHVRPEPYRRRLQAVCRDAIGRTPKTVSLHQRADGTTGVQIEPRSAKLHDCITLNLRKLDLPAVFVPFKFVLTPEREG